MTAMTYEYVDRLWTLTDESSQSSYGEPCLVSDTGEQFRASEIAVKNHISFDFATPSDITAYEIVLRGKRNNGRDIPWEDYPAFARMRERFGNQCEEGRSHNAFQRMHQTSID